MPRYSIQHRTRYKYLFPVTISHHASKVKPLNNERQICDRFKLSIEPPAHDLVEREDYFGNTSQIFSIQETHEQFTIDAESECHVEFAAADLDSLAETCGHIRQLLAQPAKPAHIDAAQFVYPTPITQYDDDVQAFGQRFLKDDAPIGASLKAFLQAFKDEFKFDSKATDINTPIGETLKHRHGVCQDFTHLMIGALRACGLSARYASGYILTAPPPGQEKLVGSDASHAWVSVYIPERGWLDIDPTNNLVCHDQHVIVAYGRDYIDVSMVSGAVTGGGEHTVEVEVTMQLLGP